jgi:hypothetical protein
LVWTSVISRISRCLTTDLVHVGVSITRVRAREKLTCVVYGVSWGCIV